MTTLPPPSTKFFPEDSLEKKVYSLVETFKDNIPVMNDRNRLGFNLFNYMMGKGDSPEISVKNSKITIEKISREELIKKLIEGLEKISSGN